MKKIKLTVYNEDMTTIKKECTAAPAKVPFGMIRKLMKLFNAETLEDTTQIVKTISTSWEDVVELLDRIFPDVEENEWDYVDTKELVSVVYALIKYAFGELLKVPTEKN